MEVRGIEDVGEFGAVPIGELGEVRRAKLGGVAGGEEGAHEVVVGEAFGELVARALKAGEAALKERNGGGERGDGGGDGPHFSAGPKREQGDGAEEGARDGDRHRSVVFGVEGG